MELFASLVAGDLLVEARGSSSLLRLVRIRSAREVFSKELRVG